MTPRDLKTASVITYTNAKDLYGVPQTTVSTTRNIEMALYIYELREVQDPRYNEVQFIGITKDDDITTANVILVGTIKYLILHIVPSRRWNSLLLREMK